jgi:hypothetical protein
LLVAGYWFEVVFRSQAPRTSNQQPATPYQLGVTLAFQRAVSADQADQQSETAEADHAGGAAGGCLAYAKDEKALEKVQH